MSKGPGIQQEAILRTLKDGRQWTVEALRWHLFETNGNRRLSSEGKLPASWSTSFERAVRRLAEIGRISINARSLESFQECVEHYPGKTLRSDARKLRMDLLPILQGWIEAEGGLRPKYGDEANERFHFRSLPKTEIQQLAANWRDLEERIRPVYGQASPSAAPHLLGLICKGRSLFNLTHSRTDISASGSLASWLDCAAKGLPDELREDLEKFANWFVPLSISSAIKFKSYIHELADVPNHGQCKLRKATLHYLLEKEPETIRGMEGFKDLGEFRKIGQIRRPLWSYEDRYQFPDALCRLFDHTVFQDFDFLSLP